MAIPIIRANQVEKYYAQPSENRIQVIAPTDLEIVPDQIVALAWAFWFGEVDAAAHADPVCRSRQPGRLYWHEKPVATANMNVSIVFQSFALFSVAHRSRKC